MLTFVFFVFVVGAAPAHAQDPESLIQECEAILEDLELQRNDAIDLVNKTAQERDILWGRMYEFTALKEENRALLSRPVVDPPSRLVWFGAGAGVTAVSVLLVLVLVQ